MSYRALPLLIGVLLAFFASFTSAQQVQKVPILDDASYFLIRVDFARLDVDAVSKWLDERIQKGTPENQRAAMQQDLAARMRQLNTMIQGVRNAGATHGYLTFASFPPEKPCFYFAKAANADETRLSAAIGALLAPGQPISPPERARPTELVIAPLGDGMFAGMSKDLQRFQQNAVGAPQLLFRLNNLPPSAVQGVGMLTDPIVQVMEAQPALPAPINMPMSTITQGVSAATFSGNLPPTLSAELKIETPDAEKAKALESLINKFAQFTLTRAKQVFPELDAQELAAALAPKLQPDNSLMVKLDDAIATNTMGDVLAIALMQARQNALLVQSASMIRQQTMAVIMYQNQKKAFPDTLKQVVYAGILGAQALKNPRGATPAEDYIYRKPAAGNNPNQIIIYENPDDVPPGSITINAGFADGHVEVIRLADLKARIAAP